VPRETDHLVVLKYTTTFPGGPWRVYLFEDKKRLFRVDFRKEGPAIFLAAQLVQQIRRNGWPCQWSVQDEEGNVTGTSVEDAARQVLERRTS